MSTKSRKAIPLKEDIVQPTSLDFDKLYETISGLVSQTDFASQMMTEQAKDIEYKLECLTAASNHLRDAAYELAEIVD